MKKTKNKIFLTIFLILTSITIYVFSFSFYQNYKMQKDMIERVLNQMNNFERNPNRNPSNPPHNKFELDNRETERRIYLGFTVYKIMLDDYGQYKEILNYTGVNSDSEEIEIIAREIIDNHEKDFFFGNLLSTKYIYSFSNNSLILLDISSTNDSLKAILSRTIILILFSEILIVLVTGLLTKWIMKPVIDSFERQKEFIADASHELKTPLSVMIASAEMYYQDKDIKWVDNMKSESERMASLVRHLLDLSKSEQDNIILSNLNLSKIVENSVLTLESLFYDKKIKLNYKIEDNIYLKCNEEQIKELMGILLDNAIKHCEKCGNVNVFLTKNAKNDIVLKVENTGNPILPSEEEKIFERFYRSDSSRNRDSNRYGLGLAIAKNIVEKHKGSIKAHSEGGITIFKIIWNQK